MVRIRALNRYLAMQEINDEVIMFRKFTIYRPIQVARFVKTLFKGKFFIEGVGEFYFDKGRVLLPDIRDKKKLLVMKEINSTIDNLAMLPA